MISHWPVCDTNVIHQYSVKCSEKLLMHINALAIQLNVRDNNEVKWTQVSDVITVIYRKNVSKLINGDHSLE